MEHDSPSFLTLITKLQGHSAFGFRFHRIPGFRLILRGPVSRRVFGPEYPLRPVMSGASDIQSRESSIIT